MTLLIGQIDIISPSRYPNLGVYKILIHITQFIFTSIILSLSANIIHIERIYYGTSQTAVNFTLAISVFNLIVLVFLILTPWSNLSTLFPNTLRKGFFLKSWPNLFLNIFLTICWFIIMMFISAHADNASNCNIDTTLQLSHPSYSIQWLNQCNCAKAAVVLCFFTFFLWVCTTILCAILLWYEKREDYDAQDSASTLVGSVYNSKFSNDSYPSLQEKGAMVMPPSAPSVTEIDETSLRPPSYTLQPIPSAYLPDNISSPAPSYTTVLSNVHPPPFSPH